jgi:hypothetical protein
MVPPWELLGRTHVCGLYCGRGNIRAGTSVATETKLAPVVHSDAMVYSDAALPGLLGDWISPKGRDDVMSYPRPPVGDLRAGTTVGADPWK